MNQPARYPQTLEPAGQWLKSAPCKADPEAMFPSSSKAEIENAKSICHYCPVIQKCGQWALDNREQYGVWGGMSEAERRSLLRRTARRARTKAITPTVTKLPPPKTLEEAFNRRAHRTADGHVTWEGAAQMKFQGVVYGALRVAFTLGHGREPEGPVDRTCGQSCFAAEHLIDETLRNSGALCGTRRGYRWHLRVGEPACGPCRQANTDADNQLRRTGTTKAAA
jgi:hypothetical protein